ncbi:MAG: hypothetical protein SCK29_09780 [Bacillota bacterium]|nr:hypothetical protein [Bacillota bacterium]MDW7684390.1 hypothetical protein [Bacillota bacterium]
MNKKIISTSAVKEMEKTVSLLNGLFKEVHTAFMKNRLSLKYRQTLEEANKTIRQSLVNFYEAAAEMGGGEEALSVQATAINLSKIFYDLVRLANQVEKKIGEKILFSDEAVAEMDDLLRRTIDLLPHVADGLRTCNALIVSHVEKEADELRKNAANSTAFHEDRLCKGKCHPKASIIYMQMLQHLQDILWHFKALVCDKGIPGA